MSEPARTRPLFRTNAETSRRMAGVRQHGTSAEISVRQALRSLGVAYRLNGRSLPGSPDVVNRKRRWVVFVHGCFWHHHEGCARATIPKSNRPAWIDKFAANQARDRRAVAALREAGFRVLTVWECQTEREADLKRRLRRFLSKCAESRRVQL